MAEVGNDCYFFFNSTCIKGSQCRFRHCEEALGSDTVCSLWRERKCLDPLCRFRHMEMQQNCSISCFWETQPLGCVKISCIFYHSKPRNINGLFLPPSSNTTLQKESQEGIQPVNHSQEPLKPQDNITRPIHHPLVLKTNFEDEEEEGEEQNDASSLWTKTPEEIEEKRAIKEMCYKSGEYYRFHTPPDISSSTSIAPTVEKELEKPLENGSGMQEGDGLTVPTKFSLFERQGEIKTSLDRKPRTDIATLENGGGDCYVPQRIIFLGVDESEALSEEKEITTPKCSNNKEDNKDSPHPKRSLTTRLVPTTHVLNATENISMKCREDPSSMNDVQPVRKPHFKGVKKRKWIYDEPKNFPGSGMRRAVQVPNPKNKMSYHHNNKNRNAENSAYIHVQRNAVRTVPLNAPPRSRPPNGSYHKADVNKEPKLNLCSDKYMSTSYKGSAWRKRIPFSKPYSKTEKIYPEPRRNGSK
uniref:Chromosome 12 open reading frame 50 n=1 Tax=Spermophilus dauricus TaxID=99837 RepID=A0A8C9QKC6_SPEDA